MFVCVWVLSVRSRTCTEGPEGEEASRREGWEKGGMDGIYQSSHID